jgi:hypothetical protein
METEDESPDMTKRRAKLMMIRPVDYITGKFQITIDAVMAGSDPRSETVISGDQ